MTSRSLASAGPGVLRNSIARDLYSGDHLARITSLTMAIFLIGPAVAPSVGELILLADDWRLVFAAALPLQARRVVHHSGILPVVPRQPVANHFDQDNLAEHPVASKPLGLRSVCLASFWTPRPCGAGS